MDSSVDPSTRSGQAPVVSLSPFDAAQGDPEALEGSSHVFVFSWQIA
jgi:hypothetical protein